MEGYGWKGTAPKMSLDELKDRGLVADNRGTAQRYLIHSRGRMPAEEVGLWAWITNRTSAAVLTVFILLHLVTLAYDPAFYRTWAFRVTLVMLAGAVTFHGLNGLRLIAGDLGLITERRAHKVLAVIAAVLAMASMVLVVTLVWGNVV